MCKGPMGCCHTCCTLNEDFLQPFVMKDTKFLRIQQMDALRSLHVCFKFEQMLKLEARSICKDFFMEQIIPYLG